MLSDLVQPEYNWGQGPLAEGEKGQVRTCKVSPQASPSDSLSLQQVRQGGLLCERKLRGRSNLEWGFEGCVGVGGGRLAGGICRFVKLVWFPSLVS